MANNLNYSIGTKGQKWTDAEKAQWLALQSIKRSYQHEVIDKIFLLKNHVDVLQYGELILNATDAEIKADDERCKSRYPLYAIKTKPWQKNKKSILITGGVHGYETSGVQGAIRFIEQWVNESAPSKSISSNISINTANTANNYTEHFNIVVVPCVSPWGYETINRWNPKAIDPNRSFYKNSPAQESAALMTFLGSLADDIIDNDFFAHIDLHETTDTDNSEFRPALAARDAIEQKNWNIPDGFYLVGNSVNPQADFQTAIIKSVEKTTHIAPADESGQLIGVPIEQWGVINYAAKALGLCMGVTNANYVTTTEVYPDSATVDDENCIMAQVEAITGALDYLLAQSLR
ncbi:MAG: M14 family metallocarboxypeptidase [Colwellia sp.]